MFFEGIDADYLEIVYIMGYLLSISQRLDYKAIQRDCRHKNINWGSSDAIENQINQLKGKGKEYTVCKVKILAWMQGL